MRATIAQFPGASAVVEIPELPDASLRQLLERGGVNWTPGTDAREVTVNGAVITDLEHRIPDGEIVTIMQRAKGA